MSPPPVEGPLRTRLGGPLKLALPRGALFGETLDALDAIGIDTAEMRGDSRSLIFDAGELTIVTMRPSDVPTYVEAGAADVGITGKDVLMEQSDRVVYEILDLRYGGCRMVLAARAGDGSLGEAERRLGALGRSGPIARGLLRAPPSPLPAPRRDDPFDATADRALPGRAGGDGRPADRAVGQGLLR